MKAKKNKQTQSKTLNPYISLFTLGGMKADPSFMPDIEEVSDTPIASDLKFDIKSGANSGNKFDGSSLPGVATSVGTTLDEDMDRKFTGEDGFQDVGKAGAFGGVRGGLKGAGAGATIGSVVPGVGTLAGAAIGFGIGATYGAIKDVNQAKDANQQLAKNKASYFAGLPKMNSANPYKDIVRNGGFKLENGGDKSLNSFNGESHENGGIKLTESAEVEGGETSYKDYVFSDSLKVPGKKITFAQATKRIEAKYKGRENDQYSERAKEQALTEYMQQNEMVKAIEERKQAHAQELQEIQMRFGGLKTHMMPDGSMMEGAVHKMVKGGKKPIGILPDMENDNSYVDYNTGEGSLPDMYKRSYLPKEPQQRIDGLNRDETGVVLPREFENTSELRSSDSSTNKKKFKFGNEETALGLSMLPGIYNVAKGWKPDVTNFQTMNPNLVNLEGEREALRKEAGKARLIANENVRSIGGGSGSALAALATQSSAINDSKMKGLSDSYQREHLSNVTTLNDFLVRNTGIQNEEYVANEQNKAMSDSLKGLGLSDLSNNAQSYMRDKALTRANERSNAMKLDAINALFPNYKWNINPENDRMMIEYMESIGGTGGLGAYIGTSNKASKSNAKGTTTTTSTSSNTKTGATTKKTTTTKRG
jgi:hypothetical protein